MARLGRAPRISPGRQRQAGRATAADLIVAALQAEGITAAFGLVGTHIVEIYDALRRAPEIRALTVKHEGNAALMADAYSRLSGKPSVCLSTAGPGLLNSLAGVAQAYAANSPTLHISGSVPSGAARRALHALDDERYSQKALAPMTRLSLRPASLAELAKNLRDGLAALRDGEPVPVHLEIPWELMLAPPGRAPRYRRRPPDRLDHGSVLEKLNGALGSARRPLFCIDALCLRHGLTQRLIGLAEAHGAMIVVSYDAFGAVPSGHPLNAGVLSDFHFGTAAADALGDADLICGFGVAKRSESERLILAHARRRPHLFSGGELQALSGAGSLGRRVKPARQPLRPWFARRCDEEWQKAVRRSAGPLRRGAMHFGRAMLALRGWIDPDTTVILDAGSHEIWARAVLPSHGPQSFLGPGNWGGMGYALPGVIGARIAAPRRRAVGITGDGCLLMSMADLCTLAEVGGPAVLIVLNNAMYGEIKRVQLERFGVSTQTRIPTLDFAAIARVFGLKGIRVDDESGLGDAYAEAFGARDPVVIDIACRGHVRFPALP